MQVASSIGRKTRSLPDNVVPRGQQGTRDEKEKTMTGRGTGVGTGTGTRTWTEMVTRAEMEVRTGAGTGTIIERCEEVKESLIIFDVAIEVGRKTLEGG